MWQFVRPFLILRRFPFNTEYIMTIPREQQVNKDQERAQLIQDIKQQNPDITDEQLNKYDIDDLRKIKIATAPEVNLKQPMQMGGMADMSAAPMVQPRKKKKKQSGFRTKYSKGGGVRAAKYKV